MAAAHIDEQQRSANFPGMKRNGSPHESAVMLDARRILFDIVNGFLKSMPWRYGFETMRIARAVRGTLRRVAIWRRGSRRSIDISTNNLAEIIIIRTKILRLCCSAEFWSVLRDLPSVVVGGADSQA